MDNVGMGVMDVNVNVVMHFLVARASIQYKYKVSINKLAFAM